ncbi:hypothetical protein N0V82_005273 [Gnomoniopsis sp. IMI 355080]|nr:hypothetical protein N0V82_005273 [Gnomoniopsis sp. IMI 355080]
MSSPLNSPIVPVHTADANEDIISLELTSSGPASVNECTMPEQIADGMEDIINIEVAPPSPFAFFCPAPVPGSDDSDTAAGSLTSDEETTIPVIVPYNGSFDSIPKAYKQDTPSEDFSDWPAYLSFCEEGPFLRLQCVGKFNDDDTPRSLKEIKISRKLLCDHSEYFKGMHRHEFQETKTGIVPLDDILHEDLMRLKLILMCGKHNGHANIGKEANEMTNLVRVYELADRFIMPEIARLIMNRTREFIASQRYWMVQYRQDVLDALAVSIITTEKENFHRAKLQDFCEAYTKLAKMGDLARLIQPDQLAKLIAECCPPRLLHSMAPCMDQEFYNTVSRKMLYNMGI